MNFDYIQNDISDLIKELTNLQENYTEETQEHFVRAVDLANELSILIERIDYLVSDEETEESFRQGLEECLEYDGYTELKF